MEQSVHVCELMCYPYIENNNEGFEGTESYVGDIKKRRQFICHAFVFDTGIVLFSRMNCFRRTNICTSTHSVQVSGSI